MSLRVELDPFEGKPVPPQGLLPRLHFYGRRQGYLYAALSYVGRFSLSFWKVVAPLFAGRKLRAWLRAPGARIVNLGGGSNLFERWITADIDPRADVYVDVTRPLPIADGMVDVVYLEEVIEHLPRDEGIALLKECFRVLKAGGVIRLTTPDLGAFARALDDTEHAEARFNDIFYNHGHRYIYSRWGLRQLLSGAGFQELAESSFRDPRSRFGHFDTHPLRSTASDSTLSQYWEATKNGS